VTGDAAIAVDPYDTAAITQAIRAVDADADLRADYTARGRRQAQAYTPEKYRQNLKAVYDRFI
jgi:glycosyltransferase involved in cell wall biosynthesis